MFIHLFMFVCVFLCVTSVGLICLCVCNQGAFEVVHSMLVSQLLLVMAHKQEYGTHPFYEGHGP